MSLNEINFTFPVTITSCLEKESETLNILNDTKLPIGISGFFRLSLLTTILFYLTLNAINFTLSVCLSAYLVSIFMRPVPLKPGACNGTCIVKQGKDSYLRPAVAPVCASGSTR